MDTKREIHIPLCEAVIILAGALVPTVGFVLAIYLGVIA